jgi:hypothetical protein
MGLDRQLSGAQRSTDIFHSGRVCQKAANKALLAHLQPAWEQVAHNRFGRDSVGATLRPAAASQPAGNLAPNRLLHGHLSLIKVAGFGAKSSGTF